MRLIDADELKKSLINFPYGLRGWVLNIIDDQPTRDIVTCGDCEYCEEGTFFFAPSIGVKCLRCKQVNGKEVHEDDWCCWAKRREE